MFSAVHHEPGISCNIFGVKLTPVTSLASSSGAKRSRTRLSAYCAAVGLVRPMNPSRTLPIVPSSKLERMSVTMRPGLMPIVLKVVAYWIVMTSLATAVFRCCENILYSFSALRSSMSLISLEAPGKPTMVMRRLGSRAPSVLSFPRRCMSTKRERNDIAMSFSMPSAVTRRVGVETTPSVKTMWVAILAKAKSSGSLSNSASAFFMSERSALTKTIGVVFISPETFTAWERSVLGGSALKVRPTTNAWPPSAVTRSATARPIP
mmetsp:Transcript_4923/g.12660  ORF Transcript_4923/g.12660 Transcript_4923/m.12660 type:complete len:264 (-) Transcript_4923:184-975(-)